MTIASVIALDALDDTKVAEAVERLGGGEIAWIDQGHAAQIRMDKSVDDARAALRGLEGADTIVLPDDFAPRVFVADMDSTMIGQECIDELAAVAGVGPQVAAITERAMNGEIDFADALRERVALLKGLDSDAILQILKDKVRPNPGAPVLVANLKARGVRCVLVSGGFTDFAENIGIRLGFDRVVANHLDIVDFRLAGTVDEPVIDAEAKKRVLELEREMFGSHAFAIGDGANDLPMLQAADLGIAYRAKPKVAEAADARLDHNRLDALLWAFGVPRSRWIID